MPRPRHANWPMILLILVCAAAVYLVGNASVPLWDRDEPRYAQTSRQMLHSGDWVVPRLLDDVRTAKPIFIYWCQIISMKFFGDNEFGARFPSAVAMLTTLLLLAVVIGRAIGPRRAMWTIFILASSALVIAAAKLCITDSVLLLWVTTANVCLAALYMSGSGGGPRPRGIAIIMWAAIALAGLTKGPVVLGILFMTMIVLVLLDVGGDFRNGRRWGEALSWWRRTRPLMGILIIVLICGPWLYLIERRAPGFIMTSLGHDVIHRSRTALEGHSGPPGFYLLTIWLTYFPWSLLLPVALVFAWKRRASRVHRYCLGAIVGPWIMFELVQTKLVHYVLPIFPALAFLTADMLVHAARRTDSILRRKPFIRIAIAWSVLVLLAAAAPWIVGRQVAYDPPALVGAVLVSLVCIAYPISIGLQFRLRRPLRAAAFMGGGMMLFSIVFYGAYLPHVGFLQISPRIGQVLRDEGAVHRGDAVMIDYEEDSLPFYQSGTIRPVSDYAFLLNTPRWDWPRWIVLTDSLWQEMPAAIRDEFDEVARVRGWWLEMRRPAEVLVVRKKSPFASRAPDISASVP